MLEWLHIDSLKRVSARRIKAAKLLERMKIEEAMSIRQNIANLQGSRSI